MSAEANVGLRSTNGPRSGAVFALSKNLNTIGRTKGCTIHLEDPSISRHHCEIVVDNGSTQIRDLNSRHGTYLNGARVESSDDVKVGDELQLGRLKFQIVAYREMPLPGVDAAPKPVAENPESETSVTASRVAPVTDAAASGESPSVGDSASASASDSAPAVTDEKVAGPCILLRAMNGSIAGRQFTLAGGKGCVGRSHSCEVVVDVKGLSRKHCILEVADDRILVKDLGSKHGTFINNVRVDDQSFASDGDVLRLAKLAFRVTVNDAASAESVLDLDLKPQSSTDNTSDGGVSGAELSWEGMSRPGGVALTGMSMEGVSLDGVSLEGMSLEGMSLDGMSLEGMSLDDLEEEGLGLDSDTDEPQPTAAIDETSGLTSSSDEVELQQRDSVLLATLLLKDLSDHDALKRMKDHVAANTSEDQEALIIDCRQLAGEASTDFWRTLVDLRRHFPKAKVPLRLCHLNEEMQEALDSTSFHRLLPVFDNVQAAIEGDRKAARAKSTASAESTTKKNSFLDDLPVTSGRILAGMGVLVVLVALLNVAFIYFSRAARPPSATDLWEMAGEATVVGQLQLGEDGEQPKPPEPYFVVAWPSSETPKSPHALQFSQLSGASADQTRAVTKRGPFITRSNKDGGFRLDVRAPQVDTVYLVLLIAEQHPDIRPIADADRIKISRFFADPEGLVGEQRYDLRRERVSPGNDTKLDPTMSERPSATQ